MSKLILSITVLCFLVVGFLVWTYLIYSLGYGDGGLNANNLCKLNNDAKQTMLEVCSDIIEDYETITYNLAYYCPEVKKGLNDGSIKILEVEE